MVIPLSARRLVRASALVAILCFGVAACSGPQRPSCDSNHEIATVCGFENPEDLAVVGDTVVVSQMRQGAEGGSLAVWNEGAAPRTLWPLEQTPGIAAGPAAGDPSCPPPDPTAFAPHGVFAAPPGLWVVNHGGRESVEVFGIENGATGAEARWLGCIELPAETSANDVVIGPRGEVVVTNMSGPGALISASLKSQFGRKTGDVLRWDSDEGWEHVPGTEASLPNGVALSDDGEWIYYAESGAGHIVRIRPDGRDRTEIAIEGRPDNLTWGADGTLYVAAHDSFWALAGCFRSSPCRSAWRVFAIEPGATKARLLLEHDGERIGAVASAQPVGDRLLLSAVFDDRIGLWSPKDKQ